MTISLSAFADAGMTTPLDTLAFAQASDGSSSGVDRVVYVGSPVAGSVYQSASNPGAGQIPVAIDVGAGGIPATAVKLATSVDGLAAAVAGAALNVGTSITGGAGNAVAIYVRVDTPALAAAVYANLSLVLGPCIEVPV